MLITRRRRLQAAVIVMVTCFALYLVWRNDPSVPGTFPSCPFLSVTGWMCPGCGSTRLIHNVLHGRIVTAFQLNPVSFAFLPLFGWMLADQLAIASVGRRLPVYEIRPWQPWVLLVFLVGWGVGRNVFGIGG